MRLRFVSGFPLIAAFFIGQLASCGSSEGPGGINGKQEKVAIGIARVESSALVFVAEELGFFNKRGLDVSIREFEAGVHAFDALLRNEVDIATAADFVFVLQSFEHSDLRILASIAATENCCLIANKDGPIRHPKDLKGKRVATVRGSTLDFFLGTFLASNGLTQDSVCILDLKPSASLDDLLKGNTDAIASFGPYSIRIRNSLGENALVWPLQDGQEYYFLAVSKEEFTRRRPLAVERFLSALLDAERFLKQNRSQAAEIIRRRLNLDSSYLPTIWTQSEFAVRLDQSLLLLMEEEAKWALRNKVSDKNGIPNHFHFVYLDGLKKLKPEGVTVIH